MRTGAGRPAEEVRFMLSPKQGARVTQAELWGWRARRPSAPGKAVGGATQPPQPDLCFSIEFLTHFCRDVSLPPQQGLVPSPSECPQGGGTGFAPLLPLGGSELFRVPARVTAGIPDSGGRANRSYALLEDCEVTLFSSDAWILSGDGRWLWDGEPGLHLGLSDSPQPFG